MTPSRPSVVLPRLHTHPTISPHAHARSDDNAKAICLSRSECRGYATTASALLKHILARYINGDHFIVSETNHPHIDIVYKRRSLHHSRNKSISYHALRHYTSRGEGKRGEGRVRRLLSKHGLDRSGPSRRKKTCYPWRTESIYERKVC